MIEQVHTDIIRPSRENYLIGKITSLLPQNTTILDVGCGDGLMDSKLATKRPDISIRGIDVLQRKKVYGQVDIFDGQTIPYDDNSFDVAMFINVLHHANDPYSLLKEGARVSRQFVLIKDHIVQGLFAKQTLTFMDDVSNKRHGVNLPYNFLSKPEWEDCFSRLNLTKVDYSENLRLYPTGLNWIFTRKLHFIGIFKKQGA